MGEFIFLEWELSAIPRYPFQINKSAIKAAIFLTLGPIL